MIDRAWWVALLVLLFLVAAIIVKALIDGDSITPADGVLSIIGGWSK